MARTRSQELPTPRVQVTADDVRAELSSWTRAELEDLAIDLLGQNEEARAAVVRQIVAKRGALTAAPVFMDQIDAALSVHHVSWRQVSEYYTRLHELVTGVQTLGKSDPAAAVSVAQYFLERLPAVVERVDAEDELGLVCEFLGQVLLECARPAGMTLGQMATRLLDAHRADQYGLTTSFPMLVATAARTDEDRSVVMELLRALGPSSDRRVREALDRIEQVRSS